MDDTSKLWSAIEDPDANPFPKAFIDALRGLLSTGLSCTQIISFMVVLKGMSELQDSFAEGELLGKSVEVLRIMRFLRKLDEVKGDETWFLDD